MSDDEPETPKPRRKRKQTVAQTMGGVLFGFEQQIWRTAPPPQELVHHARPDAPVPAGDGTLVTIELPAIEQPTMPDEPTAIPDEPGDDSTDDEGPKP